MDSSKNPPGGAPEIPSFRQGRQEQERKGGILLKPMLRVRGLGGGASLVERLKQFKKKDLVFILSGLGVLFLAPLAEHFLMGPGDDAKAIRPGFDDKGARIFTDAGSPYEPGTGGFSPGGLPGAGSDVITPLNVRDPAALVLGPGAIQQPAASVTPPATAKDSGWSDVVKDAARGSAGRALDAGGLSASKGSLAGAIRGLSALSGASYGGGSYPLPPISASNVPNRGEGGSSFSNVRPTAGYKGVAARGPAQGSNSIEAARQAAANAGNLFNRSGSAANNLDQAAREAIPMGGRGDSLGGPGAGEKGKDPGGSSIKENKSLGESLAFIRAKMEMEKQLELKWKKKEWNEFERAKMMQTEIIKGFLDGVVKKGIMDPLGQLIQGGFESLTGSDPVVACYLPSQDILIVWKRSEWKKCDGGVSGKDDGRDRRCDDYRNEPNRKKIQCKGVGVNNTDVQDDRAKQEVTHLDRLLETSVQVGADLRGSKEALDSFIQGLDGKPLSAMKESLAPLRGKALNSSVGVTAALQAQEKVLVAWAALTLTGDSMRSALDQLEGSNKDLGEALKKSQEAAQKLKDRNIAGAVADLNSARGYIAKFGNSGLLETSDATKVEMGALQRAWSNLQQARVHLKTSTDALAQASRSLTDAARDMGDSKAPTNGSVQKMNKTNARVYEGWRDKLEKILEVAGSQVEALKKSKEEAGENIESGQQLTGVAPNWIGAAYNASAGTYLKHAKDIAGYLDGKKQEAQELKSKIDASAGGAKEGAIAEYTTQIVAPLDGMIQVTEDNWKQANQAYNVANGRYDQWINPGR